MISSVVNLSSSALGIIEVVEGMISSMLSFRMTFGFGTSGFTRIEMDLLSSAVTIPEVVRPSTSITILTAYFGSIL